MWGVSGDVDLGIFNNNNSVLINSDVPENFKEMSLTDTKVAHLSKTRATIAVGNVLMS